MPKEAAVRRCLVVANQTLTGDELVRVIVRRAEERPSEFFLVVPATPVVEMWVEAMVMPYGAVPCRAVRAGRRGAGEGAGPGTSGDGHRAASRGRGHRRR